MIVIPEESILEYFCVNFVDPFRMTNVEEIKRFQTQSFFMMMIILRKQSYADFICDEACVLESVFLWFFL